MDLLTPIKQESTDREEFFHNIEVNEEDTSAYASEQHTNVKEEIASIDEELNMDNKQYSNMSFFGQKPYKCSKCNHSFDLKDFGKHKRECTGKSYPCNYCVKYFGTKKHLKLHQKTQCGDKYQYNLCDECFITKDLLEDHHETHTGDKPNQCSQRDKFFAQHSAHVQQKRMHTVKSPFKCNNNQCDIYYFRQDQIKQLTEKHREELLCHYQCSHCVKSFTCQVDLDKHLFTHTHQKPYKCSFCNKCYSYKDNLEKHKRLAMHTGQKPYKCNNCEKSFSRKIYLERHKKLHTGLAMHTGQKTYKCNNCEKSFSREVYLERHKKLHTREKVTEKQYQCSYCNKNIDLKSYLDKHLSTDKGQKTYQCNQCENDLKSFSQKQYLKQHKKIQTEKSYHSTDNNESSIQESNIIVNWVMGISEKDSNQHMIKQSEIKPQKVEIQQYTRFYPNLKISNNLYEVLNNAPVAAKNYNMNTDEVKDISNNKSSMFWEKENIHVKVEPKNMVGTINLFSKVDFPLMVNHKVDASDDSSDQAMDVKIEEISIKYN